MQGEPVAEPDDLAWADMVFTGGMLFQQVDTLAIIPSGGGVFEVHKDGDLIFSKRESGRFPE